MLINKNGIPVGVLNEKTMVLTKVGSGRLKDLIDAWRKHGMESFGPGGISTDEVMADAIVVDPFTPANIGLVISQLRDEGFDAILDEG